MNVWPKLIQPQTVTFDLMMKSGGSKVLMALSNPEAVKSLFHFKSPSPDCITRSNISRRQSDAHSALQIEISPPKFWLNNPWKSLIQIRFCRTKRTGEFKSQVNVSRYDSWIGSWIMHSNKDVCWKRTNRCRFSDCSLSETWGEVRSMEWVWEHDYFCVSSQQ